jgi:hypothetical protein
MYGHMYVGIGAGKSCLRIPGLSNCDRLVCHCLDKDLLPTRRRASEEDDAERLPKICQQGRHTSEEDDAERRLKICCQQGRRTSEEDDAERRLKICCQQGAQVKKTMWNGA